MEKNKLSFKKTYLLTILIIILSISNVTSAFAYVVYYIPEATSFTYKISSYYANDIGSQATTAASTWNSVPGYPTFTNGGSFSGNIVFGDANNVVFMINFSTVDGFSSTAYGANAVVRSADLNRITCFDIALNTMKTWGDGWSSSFQDKQGILTHEFGHSVGLGDVIPTNYGSDYLPTMSAHGNAPWGEYLGYYLRTLLNDDIEGKTYISSQI